MSARGTWKEEQPYRKNRKKIKKGVSEKPRAKAVFSYGGAMFLMTEKKGGEAVLKDKGGGGCLQNKKLGP